MFFIILVKQQMAHLNLLIEFIKKKNLFPCETRICQFRLILNKLNIRKHSTSIMNELLGNTKRTSRMGLIWSDAFPASTRMGRTKHAVCGWKEYSKKRMGQIGYIFTFHPPSFFSRFYRKLGQSAFL